VQDISFALIAIGALISLARRSMRSGGQMAVFDLLATLTVVAVAGASSVGIFVGPVADSQSYHETINACLGKMPPCSNKLHEVLWGLLAMVAGPAWALVYGFVISSALALVASGGTVSLRAPLTALVFLYAAYQIGNGMAEGSYFLLLLGGLMALHAGRFIRGSMLLLAAVAGHLGNLPFVFYVLGFPRGWPTIVVSGMLAFALAAMWGGISMDDILQITNKAGALVSQEATLSALEGKLRVSIRDADTSYAELLLDNGFPHTIRSILYAFALYVAPVIIGTGSIIGFIVALLSSATSASVLWLSRDRPILLLVTLLSFAIFAMGSFTPGIGLRHKVPLLLFALAVRNPLITKGQTWRISR
jgi:hypothetical protein